MSRITTYDKLRGCYVIEPDNNQNHIQRLGELEDRDDANCGGTEYDYEAGENVCAKCKSDIDIGYDIFCPICGQRLRGSEVNETL